MTVLTNEVPVEILSPHEPPCLSLYQPTHRSTLGRLRDR